MVGAGSGTDATIAVLPSSTLSFDIFLVIPATANNVDACNVDPAQVAVAVSPLYTAFVS